MTKQVSAAIKTGKKTVTSKTEVETPKELRTRYMKAAAKGSPGGVVRGTFLPPGYQL
jgi:hypothetical protein